MDIKIITTTKEVYITKDGKQFDNEEQAREWQECLMIIDELKKLDCLVEILEKIIDECKTIKKFLKTIDKQ